MSGPLRIAISYFTLVPVQRWANVAGGSLLALAALIIAFANDHPVAGFGVFLLTLGLALIGITPVFGGGVAMRVASTPTLLHLRPYGRLRLLAGTTLVITMLAALSALPALVMDWFVPEPGEPLSDGNVGALVMFEGAWTAMALCWIIMFTISRSLLAFAAIGLIPVVTINVAKYLAPLFPSVTWVFACGLFAWALFALWYLKTPSVKRPEFPIHNPLATSFQNSSAVRLAALGTPKGAFSRERGTFFYIFACGSPLYFVGIGAWVTVLFLLVGVLTQASTGKSEFRMAGQLLGMLPFFSFFGASIGYTTARRMRFIWLRAGMDRSGLFRLAERWGLRSVLTAWSMAASAALIIALVSGRGSAMEYILFVVVQGFMTIALFYAGTAAVRNWSPGELLIYAGITIAFIFQAVTLMPMRDVSMGMMIADLLLAVFLVVYFRWRALRRWQTLDWRVAKVTQLGMGV